MDEQEDGTVMATLEEILPEIHDEADEILPLPDLAEIQIKSYQWFLEQGLRELLDHFSPVEDYTGSIAITFEDYRFEEPKKTVEECKESDSTYEMSWYVRVRLVNRETGDIKESEVYMGEIPKMTERGTFIINGAERVVISQLTRSPGVYFRDSIDPSGRILYSAQVIPAEGPWVEVDTSSQGIISVKLGQTRKLPVTTLMRVLQWLEEGESYTSSCPPTGTDAEILEYFGERKKLSVKEMIDAIARRAEEAVPGTELYSEFYSVKEIRDPVHDRLIVEAYGHLDHRRLRELQNIGIKELEVVEVPHLIHNTLEADDTFSPKDALLDLYRKIRPGDQPTEEAAEQLLRAFFTDPRRYDLSRVGRYKLNRRLGLDVPEDVRHITRADVLAIVDYIIKLYRGEGQVDDIDHLMNKRVRAVGELVQNQMRLGFLRMERVAKERMATVAPDELVPQLAISIKPIQAAINSFFGSGQLSQFMDQINPLSELAHKRRLSSMGPGGLSRQSAKLEVRDVHHSHYGRICPIETPEGPNVGLIGYLALYAQLDEFGFIRTPYRRVKNGVVTDEIVYLSPDEEANYNIASASEPRDENGRFINERITVRRGGKFPTVAREEVDFCDLTAKQVFSIATALIPFLENCDAVRALAGSNMQRQAVPLVVTEAPIVGTGLEERAARDSGAVVVAKRSGRVTYVDGRRIEITTSSGDVDVYELRKFSRTNMSTCHNQKPLVRPGQSVKAGQVIADGASTSGGRLALGRNLLVAFISWEGYNYEDAIVISERLVKEDVLTSIHIEKFECEARDTKLGPEEITRDIPNVGEDALKDLDEQGVVRVGAEVGPSDILVGKVAPKGQSELTAEEKLIIAIFGKKAEEMRDVSLRLPHGSKGIVIGTQVFSRHKYQCRSCGAVYGYGKPLEATQMECERCGGRLKKIPGDELKPGVNQMVRVFVAQRRKVQVGDKMTGRHGNKGVIAKIVPEEDMPFLPDGTPVDICLNPLSVPSRMNLGQLLETHLGYIGWKLGRYFKCPVFMGYKYKQILQGLEYLEGLMRADALRDYAQHELNFPGEVVDLKHLPEDATIEQIRDEILSQLKAKGKQALEAHAEWLGIPPEQWQRAPDDEAAAKLILEQVEANAWNRVQFIGREGKSILYDGRTGEPFNMPVCVGTIYMLKLNHLVEDKIHARSTGPYSLITQQPLGGKAQMGGQRFGEMEVWALEAYGAAHSLQEMLTIKSDDVQGRVEAYEAIVKDQNIKEPGIPESFKILVREMQSLALDVRVEDKEGNEIDLSSVSEDIR